MAANLPGVLVVLNGVEDAGRVGALLTGAYSADVIPGLEAGVVQLGDGGAWVAVVVDGGFPGMSASEVVARVASKATAADLPLVALCAGALSEWAYVLGRSGASAVLDRETALAADSPVLRCALDVLRGHWAYRAESHGDRLDRALAGAAALSVVRDRLESLEASLSTEEAPRPGALAVVLAWASENPGKTKATIAGIVAGLGAGVAAALEVLGILP